MKLEELKKGLWGYQKDAVFRYISEQEELFAQKLMEKDAQMEQSSRRFQARIQELEEENRQLKEELGRLREQQDRISQAILDARASAEALKRETQAQEEAAREAVRQAMERDLAELAGYQERIAALRKAIQAAVRGLEDQAAEMQQQAQALYEAVPVGNLTLFE